MQRCWLLRSGSSSSLIRLSKPAFLHSEPLSCAGFLGLMSMYGQPQGEASDFWEKRPSTLNGPMEKDCSTWCGPFFPEPCSLFVILRKVSHSKLSVSYPYHTHFRNILVSCPFLQAQHPLSSASLSISVFKLSVRTHKSVFTLSSLFGCKVPSQ